MVPVSPDPDELILHRMASRPLRLLPKYLIGVECGGSTTGFASPADDYIETHLDLNQYHKIKPHTCFLVEAFGQSMIDADIREKDLLIVDTNLDYRDGDIVVCTLNGSLKAKVIERREGRLLLVSRNKDFPPIELEEYDDVRIFGVVRGISRHFR